MENAIINFSADHIIRSLFQILRGETGQYPEPARTTFNHPKRLWNCKHYDSCLDYAVRMRNVENRLNIDSHLWKSWQCPGNCICFVAEEKRYSSLQSVCIDNFIINGSKFYEYV